jgi:spermidine/putrescine transport system substrate-binding protein
MRRRTFLAGIAGTAACAHKPRLNVYNWSDYVAPDTISNFEHEFGVNVRYGTYEGSAEMLAKVMSGNSGWDVIFPAAEFVPPMIELGLFAPLIHERLGNLGALDAEFQHPRWDPGLQFTVPYMHGTTGIVFQKKLALSSWADLWDPRLSGKMTMLDDPLEVFAACLKKIGDSVNTGDPSQLRAAEQQAMTQKKLLRAYLNAEVRDQLVAGDVAVAQAWAVTAGQAISAAPDKLAYAFPAEGFARYADNIAILRESSRVDLAHDFINYLLRPEVAAKIVQATQTGTANAEALKLLPPAVRGNPVLYPPAELLKRGEWFEPQTTASQKLRDRLWTEVKSSA